MLKEGQGFKISYRGDAVDDGSMDVRDFAPALIALGELLNEAHGIINKGKPEIKLEIRATEKSSFDVNLFATFYQEVVDFFSKPDVQAIGLILAYLGISGKDVVKGLFPLIKYSGGRKPKQVIKLGDGGRVEFDFGGGDKIEVHAPTADLYADSRIRGHISNIVKPLQQKGIDSFEIQHKSEKTFELQKDEIKSFEPPQIEDQIITDVSNLKVFSIISLAFKEDNKWRLSDGDNTYSVLIKDEEFIERIKRNQESFSMGSLLRVNLRTIQYKTDIGLKTEYEILKVIEHVAPHKQLNLPF